jgi:hypothetical protein
MLYSEELSVVNGVDGVVERITKRNSGVLNSALPALSALASLSGYSSR